ncbi:hypothetical protein COCNU_02G017930 [Cocos nucifera]|uniref:Uncharacterized protein n=1 Tax=Cocos nucifera TaxID=13894 RepID=A0A8K0I0V8_COCNU|nr:hypothetical protein COCNU_02G017930 [Cocos nucifera]
MSSLCFSSDVAASFSNVTNSIGMIQGGTSYASLLGVAKLEEALELDEAAIKVTEEKEKLIKALAEVEKSKVVAEARLKAIKEFKASACFEAEVAKGSSMAYEYKFEAYKVSVVWLFSGVDISGLDPIAEASTSKPIIEVIVKLVPKGCYQAYNQGCC